MYVFIPINMTNALISCRD